jgi:hypothetical protein
VFALELSATCGIGATPGGALATDPLEIREATEVDEALATGPAAFDGNLTVPKSHPSCCAGAFFCAMDLLLSSDSETDDESFSACHLRYRSINSTRKEFFFAADLRNRCFNRSFAVGRYSIV